MKLIDTHTHIYGEEFDEDIQQVVERAKERGIYKIFLPNIDKTSVDRVWNLYETDKETFYPMMGLYPGSVTSDVENELKETLEWIERPGVCAIGEIGLDFYWDREFEQEQIHAFQTQLLWSKERNNMPFSIHCRKAFDETLKCLKQDNRPKFNGVFHCFAGDKRQAEKVIEMGFFLGIGGVLTFKNAHLAEVVKEIPLQHIVLETDAPYLTPVPHRGKRNESAYIEIIAEKIAEIKEISVEQVAEQTTQNALKAFNLE